MDNQINPNINQCNTWQQGRFIDHIRYSSWSWEDKEAAQRIEELLVRPYTTGNAICKATLPEHAIWIAERLNQATKLEKRVEELEKAVINHAFDSRPLHPHNQKLLATCCLDFNEALEKWRVDDIDDSNDFNWHE